MISLESAHFITKFYLIGYFICFVLSFVKENNKSNLIIVSLVFFYSVLDQYLKMELGFYTFYYGAALGCATVVLVSVLSHLYLKVRHQKVTALMYICFLLMAASYMIVYRVRVVIYETDEPISWLINGQSWFTLIIYFLILLLCFYGCNVKWKLQFGRLFSSS